MVYVPDWERLPDALKRVMAAGLSEDQAKLDISRAVADKKIRTRLTVVIEPDAFANGHRMAQNAQGLGPPAEWKRLPDALARLKAIGIGEAQAKRDICRAIANRRIKIRFRVEQEERIGALGEHVTGSLRSGGEVEIPTVLNPDDFNWQLSRPLTPWRGTGQGQSALAGLWHIEWIELLISHGNETVDYFEGPNVSVPPHLEPADFDWDASRPLNPWPVRPRGARLDEWRSFSLPATLIELQISDVAKVLCVGEQANKKAERPNTTAAQESTAIKALAEHLKTNVAMRRSDAEDWCKAAKYRLGKRAFARVWPEARERAGLERIAAPGRKRNSSRRNHPA
jgi:hypothetical protein